MVKLKRQLAVTISLIIVILILAGVFVYLYFNNPDKITNQTKKIKPAEVTYDKFVALNNPVPTSVPSPTITSTNTFLPLDGLTPTTAVASASATPTLRPTVVSTTTPQLSPTTVAVSSTPIPAVSRLPQTGLLTNTLVLAGFSMFFIAVAFIL